MKNSDVLRAMSDEELAEYLCGWIYCPDCPGHEESSPGCSKVLLDWLQSPAEGGDHDA